MKHHRIVVDANVLISAILCGGPPREVLKLVISGTVGSSLSMLDELRRIKILTPTAYIKIVKDAELPTNSSGRRPKGRAEVCIRGTL